MGVTQNASKLYFMLVRQLIEKSINLQTANKLEQGAGINLADNEGNTAFLVACLEGHFDAALYLKKKGASTSGKDPTRAVFISYIKIKSQTSWAILRCGVRFAITTCPL